MTLITLNLYIAIAALIATGLTIYAGKSKRWFITFLQFFCGFLFLVSGFVKAVDPLGTAFKMEQYFSAFYYTFSETPFSFLGGIFTFLASYVKLFSIFMIVLEMIIGVMLVFGIKPRTTSWAFFLLIIFFTKLTGFTFLTGYVPQEANFFDFSQWGEFLKTNMRVSDCGCFGDFIKIEPRSSFIKDLFLLIPAIIFLFQHRYFHKLLTSGARLGIWILSSVAFLFYCLNYTYWAEPSFDFRPFKEGTDVRTKRASELKADAERPVSQEITSKLTGQSVTLTMDEYMKRFKEFSKDSFDFRTITGEPAIPRTKISDFIISDSDGNDVSETILDHEGYSLMIVNYKVDVTKETQVIEKADTTFTKPDTTVVGKDTILTPGQIAKITKVSEQVSVPVFAADWLDTYKQKLVPIVDQASKQKIPSLAILGGVGDEDLKKAIELIGHNISFYQADEILLKTMIRSNPGLILWKDGTIVKKWHINKIPDWETIASYIKK